MVTESRSAQLKITYFFFVIVIYSCLTFLLFKPIDLFFVLFKFLINLFIYFGCCVQLVVF